MAKTYWVYKCNSKSKFRASGDWNALFIDNRPADWGTTELLPDLRKAERGHIILAYQTDRNELVGTAEVVRITPKGKHRLVLKPIQKLGVKVRSLRRKDRSLARISAFFQPGPIRTLYPITPREARRILKAAAAEIRSGQEIARAEARRAKKSLGGKGGGGFGTSESNRAVDRAAIKFVSQYFRDYGWKVDDVSRNKSLGYDLLCSRGKTRRHVEVKGVSGPKRRFIITAAEKRAWSSDSKFLLALLTNARSSHPHLEIHLGPKTMANFIFSPVSFFAVGASNPS